MTARPSLTYNALVDRGKKALVIETDEESLAAGASGSHTRWPSKRPQSGSSRAARSTSKSSSSPQMESRTKTWPLLTAQGNRGMLSDRTHTRYASTPTSKGRTTPTSMHSCWGDLEATARDLHETMDPHGEQFKPADGLKWDRLTIWQRFNKIDEDHNGNVSKQEWLSFLRQNPKFRALLLNMGESAYPDRFSKISLQRLRVEAKEMKKVMQIWKELDADNNGALDFDEFVKIFQHTGHYLQYRDEANPRDQVASILSGTQENALVSSSAHTVMQLAKHHVSSGRRPTIQFDLMQQIAAESPTALHICP